MTVKRIAMWSGPRNLSTAMMYSFAARPDCAVWDEPFYAPYLRQSGARHPMRDEIVAAHNTDPDAVATQCVGFIPGEASVFYMKHMSHHMLPGFPLDWAEQCINIHLIRHPARVIASYGKLQPDMTLGDVGFQQQVDVFNRVGGVVIDSFDIRRNPEAALRRLCHEIGIPFAGEMLQWRKGGHAADGVWAAHWYGAIHASTGFSGSEQDLPELDAHETGVCAQSMPYFEQLFAKRLIISSD